MFLSDLIYILIVQLTLILVVLLSITYFFSGKEYKLSNYLRITIGLYVGLFIGFIYIFDITNYLYSLLILLSLLTIYLGIYSSLSALLLIALIQIGFQGFENNLLVYLLLILSIKWIHLFIRDTKKIQISIFILSFIFLNIEIWLTNSHYLIINMFSIVSWSVLLLIISKIQTNMKSLNEYKKQYYYDHITSVKNYYCLLEHSSTILHKKNNPIAVILINIDHLKDINNLYGNYFGNKVIQLVSETIKKTISEFGDHYRIDGDTFCVVSNEKYKMIQTICDQIRHDIDIKEVINDNNKINISVSIGAYCGFINSKNIDDYIELAQDALFQSKSFGRNKVIIKKQG